jgi:hypothetical protein
LNGGPPVSLSGTGVVGVGVPGGGHVPIELLSLSLTGPGVALHLRPGTTSAGSIDQQGPGSPLADSFFDIFFELDLGGPPIANLTPARLAASGLTTWPDGTYNLVQPVPLFLPGDQPIGFLTGASETIAPEPMSLLALGSGLAGIFLARKKLVRP